MSWKKALFQSLLNERLTAITLALLMTISLAHTSDQFKCSLDLDYMSTKNCSARKPQAVILHYTGGCDESAKNWLAKEGAGVSANYLVKSDANIVQIVPDGKRAWHAGRGSWRGFEDINSLSLGIEITSWGYDGKHVPQDIDRTNCVTCEGSDLAWFPFPEDQFQSIASLLVDFKKRWKIKPQFFIGHSDLAPGRKVDPGPLFPWERLHKEFEIGAWPNLNTPLQFVDLPTVGKEILWTQLRLRDYGYRCPLTAKLDQQTIATVQAFQMHFRPSKIDGQIDDETLAILAHLVDQYHYSDI